MRRPALAAISAAATLLLSSVALATSAGAAPPSGSPSLVHRNTPVCAAPVAGAATCHAIRRDTVDRNGKPVPTATTTTPAGYGPGALQAAYGLDGVSGAGNTVAIVDAYHDPNAEADLGTYRSQFGLDPCTTGNLCFKQVDQTGGASYPTANGGWGQEISLDLDMVSAACPACHILLVEAKSSSFSDLAAAVNYAASQPNVAAISNSYGGSELNNSAIASAYDHKGIAVTASTGDSGYGAQSPATFPGVIAVGGTSLKRASNTRGWTETAWSGAGSGCSAYFTALWTQTGTSCAKKAVADVSAVADPNTGVAVYDSYAYQGRSGWMVFGGTSASSPIIASVYAQNTANFGDYPAAYTWAHASELNDVTSGSNGRCRTKVWCTAGSHWDGPTGLGTPNGTGAF
jgi:subtilase family serine protease